MKRLSKFSVNSIKAVSRTRFIIVFLAVLKSFLAVSLVIFYFTACSTGTGKKFINRQDGKSINFYVVADVGRNGYYKQKNIAEQMGIMSESIEPDFIISAGDCFHGNGVRSTTDPIWISNFESIYTHPGLHCNWYPVLGNHEYHGNTQAVIDYSYISTSSGSLARPCYSDDVTMFTSHDEGFTLCSVSRHNLVFRFVDINGETLYQYIRERK